ncbi:hypothetical protein L596_006145 [Steinernema carpocapsae]|uniref:Uncharacterized protein n=1 Tax=Steinernema carpocapsae TaxID=34508 RepID=A0A4U8V6T5_STECR|nr:hypothetical protein L596_006145 [Steinernema carpocapsae]
MLSFFHKFRTKPNMRVLVFYSAHVSIAISQCKSVGSDFWKMPFESFPTASVMTFPLNAAGNFTGSVIQLVTFGT